MITLNDLTPNLRCQKKNVLVAAFWMSEADLNIEHFFKSFVKELNYLFTNGITVYGKNYKIVVAGCCLDSVARCKLLCMKQFNGSYGCTYCLHPTNSQKYPYKDASLRTMDHFNDCVSKWSDLSEDQKKKVLQFLG